MSDRGVSTPIDVGLGLLLVSAAILVVVGIQPPVEAGPTPDGPVLLGSRMAVSYLHDGSTATVTGSMGGLVGDAVLAGRGTVTPTDRAFRKSVRERVERRVERFTVPMQVVGYCAATSGGATFRAGADVPPGEPVEASVFEVPAPDRPTSNTPRSEGSPSAGTEPPTRCDPSVVVRWWHP